ncbi:GGDEF domain-containing protein [Paraliobacillus quinghaiensis]|uniref:GGDEF domain-containing protein n=1 Tax=Paraliobacillus quinghaiensis TaxID=470815 RepID=UPI003B839399
MSGEEFTILISDCHHDHVLQIAENIRKNVEQHNFLINKGTKKINITVSIGATTFHTTTRKIDDLYRNADAALYKAKISRNRVCSYSE